MEDNRLLALDLTASIKLVVISVFLTTETVICVSSFVSLICSCWACCCLIIVSREVCLFCRFSFSSVLADFISSSASFNKSSLFFIDSSKLSKLLVAPELFKVFFKLSPFLTSSSPIFFLSF